MCVRICIYNMYRYICIFLFICPSIYSFIQSLSLSLYIYIYIYVIYTYISLPYSILGTSQIFPSISQHLTSLTSLTAIRQFPGCQRHPYPPHVPWCTSQQPRKCRDPFAVDAWLEPLALGASKSLQPFQPSWPWHLGDTWEPQECLGWAKVIVCVYVFRVITCLCGYATYLFIVIY